MIAEEVKAEMKRVVRHWQRFDCDTRANMESSHRLGHRQRHQVGSFFYTHPDVGGICFEKRSVAARAAVERRNAASR